RVQRARPRPYADLIQAGGVDLDQDESVGRVALRDAEAGVRQLVVDEVERAEIVQQRDQRTDQHALNDECDMRLHARRPAGHERAGLRAACSTASDCGRYANGSIIVGIEIILGRLAGSAPIRGDEQYRRASLSSSFSVRMMVVVVVAGPAA